MISSQSKCIELSLSVTPFGLCVVAWGLEIKIGFIMLFALSSLLGWAKQQSELDREMKREGDRERRGERDRLTWDLNEHKQGSPDTEEASEKERREG